MFHVSCPIVFKFSIVLYDRVFILTFTFAEILIGLVYEKGNILPQRARRVQRKNLRGKKPQNFYSIFYNLCVLGVLCGERNC